MRRDKNKLSFMAPFESFMLHIFPMINMAVTSTVSVALKLGGTTRYSTDWLSLASQAICIPLLPT
jgi:hypothetical protein